MGPIAVVYYKDIPGFPGYRAGSDGSIWSNWERGTSKRLDCWNWRRIDKSSNDAYPYPYAILKGFGFPITTYRLVMLTFVGPQPKGTVIRHLDDDKNNNCLWNLAYGTYSENSMDAYRNGKMKTMSKLTNEDVMEIRRLANDGVGRHRLCHDFGSSLIVIENIIRGKSRRYPLQSQN